jgi:hypothetical protein
MIGRRPAATYELLSEEALLEGAGSGPNPAAAPADPGAESASGGAARQTRSRGAARRTLAITLGAALVAGLAVWELLGLVAPSTDRVAGAAPSARTAAAPAPLTPAPRSPRALKPSPPRPTGARRARVIAHAPGQQTPIAAARAPAPTVSPTVPPGPALAIAAPVAIAEREFGFER